MALPRQPGTMCRVWTWLATPTHLAIHYGLISAMPSQSIVNSQGLALLGSSKLLLPTVDILLLGSSSADTEPAMSYMYSAFTYVYVLYSTFYMYSMRLWGENWV